MKTFATVAAAFFISAGLAHAAGPLEGIEKQLPKNGAFDKTTYGATSKGANEPGDVSFSRFGTGSKGAIGVDSGRGGEHAADASVVGPTVDSGPSGTRVDLPN